MLLPACPSSLSVRSRKIIPLLFSLLFSATLFAQLPRKIDSLQKALAVAKQDTNRVELLYTLARYAKVSDTEKALDYANEALALAKKLGHASGEIYSYNTLSIIQQDKGDYMLALSYLDTCIGLAEAAADTYAVAMCKNNIGLIYLDQGNYEKALPFLLESAALREKIGDTRGQAGSYNNIGLLYEYMNNHEKAIEHYRLSLELKQQLGDKQGMGNTYLNIGLSYSGLQDTAKEKENYRKALALYEEIGDKKGQSMVYNNLGEISSAEEDDSLAFVYLGKAYALRAELGDIVGQAQTGTNLARCYIRQNKLDVAQEYLLQSLGHAREAESKKEMSLAYAVFSELNVKQNDFRTALENYKLSALYKDSMLNEESNMHIEELQAKYETEKKEKEILLLKAEDERKAFLLERRNFQIATVIFIGLVLAGMGWFFFTRYKARQQRLNELAILETKQTERIRIARDMHDDIGSGLSRISLLSEQVKAALQGPTGTNQLDKTLGSLTKLSAESRQLTGSIGEIIWTMSPKNDTLEGLVSYVRNYAYDYLEHAGIECTIDFPDEVPEVTVPAELRRNVFLAVKESLHNIVKHSACTAAKLELHLHEDSFTLAISDNGKGLGESKKPGGGHGLVNMKKRIEETGGAYRVESVQGKGVKVVLENIPLKNTTKV